MDTNIFTNALINESSPYLLQHAHNPVHWYPWGKEAFAKAKSENKPVFLSIGYSSCHWCHVMERESFEDDEVADYLNACFVSIKVDKEERPDIDSVYMNVCQALTGSGGWPLTVFMTPDQKPFFAGTYFPKKSRYGRPGSLICSVRLPISGRKHRRSFIPRARKSPRQCHKQMRRYPAAVRSALTRLRKPRSILTRLLMRITAVSGILQNSLRLTT